MTYTLYSTDGKPEQVDSAIFGEMPADAIALKYTDEIDGARWITDESELTKLRIDGAAIAVTEEQYNEEQLSDLVTGDLEAGR